MYRMQKHRWQSVLFVCVFGLTATTFCEVRDKIFCFYGDFQYILLVFGWILAFRCTVHFLFKKYQNKYVSMIQHHVSMIQHRLSLFICVTVSLCIRVTVLFFPFDFHIRRQWSPFATKTVFHLTFAGIIKRAWVSFKVNKLSIGIKTSAPSSLALCYSTYTNFCLIFI